MDMQQLVNSLSSGQKQELLHILSCSSSKPFATPQPAQLLCQPMQGTTAALPLAASQQQAAQYHQLTCSLLSHTTQLPVPVLLPLSYNVHDKLFNMATQLPEPCRLQLMHLVPILQHSPAGPCLDYMAGQVVTFIKTHTAPLSRFAWEAALQVLQDLQELLPLRGQIAYLQLCGQLLLAKTLDELVLQLAYVKAELKEWLKVNAAPAAAAPAAAAPAAAAAAALPAPAAALLAAAAAAEAGLSLMFPEALPALLSMASPVPALLSMASPVQALLSMASPVQALLSMASPVQALLSMASPVQADAQHFLLAYLQQPVAVQALAALAHLGKLPFNTPDGTGSLLATLAYMLSVAVRCGMLGGPAHTASYSSAARVVRCTCQECSAASRASGLDKLLTLLWTAEWFNGNRYRSHCTHALYDYFYTATDVCAAIWLA
ncbi:hypothetical protein OEZ85_008109 [Tetradesmus obliquus]|uniref:Uncharacterized protein n=1 Tax=Tetradesmus obliquus TaxID=3088 RepID=A0ABY8THX6_TETOB|nr:hypothetical protein OEZ85_008109 [Tetradesmus obliquus]